VPLELEKLPPPYSTRVARALADERRDGELLADLRHLREVHHHAAMHQARLLKEYDRDGMREGREQILKTVQESRVYCMAVAEVAAKAIDTISGFAP
jgi:hypothetical protein